MVPRHPLVLPYFWTRCRCQGSGDTLHLVFAGILEGEAGARNEVLHSLGHEHLRGPARAVTLAPSRGVGTPPPSEIWRTDEHGDMTVTFGPAGPLVAANR
jgi:hypothetical protein